MIQRFLALYDVENSGLDPLASLYGGSGGISFETVAALTQLRNF